MIVTRFNPTTNGGLHLGHIYSLLINEHYAHDNNGKFYVRFDDTSAAIHTEMAHPEIAKEILKRQREDIEWLGVKVDGWIIQSEILEEVHEKMQPRYAILQDKRPHYLPVSIRLGNSWTPYPYVPFETAERVIMDQMIGATHLIRGEEFLTEYSMYRYFCEIFNFDYPKFWLTMAALFLVYFTIWLLSKNPNFTFSRDADTGALSQERQQQSDDLEKKILGEE